jgi:hypothetical protein
MAYLDKETDAARGSRRIADVMQQHGCGGITMAGSLMRWPTAAGFASDPQMQHVLASSTLRSNLSIGALYRESSDNPTDMEPKTHVYNK